MYRSKQKMKEVELRLLSRYRDLFNNMPLPYIRQRLIREGTQIDVQVLDVNHAFEEKIAPKDFVVNNRIVKPCRLKIILISEGFSTL